MDTKLIRMILMSVFLLITQSHNALAYDLVERNGYEYHVEQKPGVMVAFEATQVGRTSLNDDLWTVGGEWVHKGATCTVKTLDIDARYSDEHYKCKYLYVNKPDFTTLKKFDVSGVEQVVLGYDEPFLTNRGYLTVCEGAMENTSSNIKVIVINNTVLQISSKAFFGMKEGMIRSTSTIPPILASDAFCDEAYENVTLCVPDSKMNEYKNSNWGKFKKIISDMTFETPELVDRKFDLMIGDMVQLKLKGSIPEEYLEWKSDADTIASVHDGKVYAKAAGRAIISVTNTLNESEDQALIEVKAPLTSIEIDYSGKDSDEFDDPGINIQDYFLEDGTIQLLKGDEYQIKLLNDPTHLLYEPVKWVSANPKIAEVKPDGTVTAISEGETTIIISTTSGISKKVPINVVNYFFYDHIKYYVQSMEGVVADVEKTIFPYMYIQDYLSSFNSTTLLRGNIVLPANPRSISQIFTLTRLPARCFENQRRIESIKIPNTVHNRRLCL